MYYYHWSNLLPLPGVILMFWADHRVKVTYKRYSKVRSSLGMTGLEVAEMILQRMGIRDVAIGLVDGELTDHYDPSEKTIRLSKGIYGSKSLAAAAVAAHECGHVLQHKQDYAFLNIRDNLVPAAIIGSGFGPLLVVGGILFSSLGVFPAFSSLGTFSALMINIGIVLFTAVSAFHIITLPVEFDASRRALKLINELGILQGNENKAARAVLEAAAWTYVAGTFHSVLELIQLLIISKER